VRHTIGISKSGIDATGLRGPKVPRQSPRPIKIATFVSHRDLRLIQELCADISVLVKIANEVVLEMYTRPTGFICAGSNYRELPSSLRHHGCQRPTCLESAIPCSSSIVGNGRYK
jgi:hypothetical protein